MALAVNVPQAAAILMAGAAAGGSDWRVARRARGSTYQSGFVLPAGLSGHVFDRFQVGVGCGQVTWFCNVLF